MSRRSIGAQLAFLVVFVTSIGFLAGRGTAPSTTSGSPSATPAEPSASSAHLVDIGGVYQADAGIGLADLPPSELPYPYTKPIPPEAPTPLDGAYVRIIPIERLGPPMLALPLQCLRCIPFRITAGVATLILYQGRYFLHDHLSDFKALGFYEIHGSRVSFYDDPNCPTSRGIYRWSESASNLHLEVVKDPCPFDNLRADDLTTFHWTAFDHCLLRFVDLWPGQLGCKDRALQP
jgi:hypothetical protein